MGEGARRAGEDNPSLAADVRDPLRQPFHQDSIWNRPIGSKAVYVPAQIQKATAHGVTVDEDLVVLTPDAPLLDIYGNDAGWNRNRSRCTIDSPLLFRAPIPTDFIVSPETWDGLTPNSGLAVLLPDGRTIQQTQPFARCTAEYGTSRYLFEDEDHYGQNATGALKSTLALATTRGHATWLGSIRRTGMSVGFYIVSFADFVQRQVGCRTCPSVSVLSMTSDSTTTMPR